MAGTVFGYPYDENLFLYNWKQVPDTVSQALYESGAMIDNPEIGAMISQGSDSYTVPFYNVLGGDPQNYDGATDIEPDSPEGTSQNGVVIGRAKAWTAKDFIPDFASGADPMTNIISQIAGYWNKYAQTVVLTELAGCFGYTTGDYATEWAKHTTDISSSSTTVAAANKLGATSVGDAIVKACGDYAQGHFGLAIMHSTVANNLAGIDLLEFRKYTDAAGIQRQLPIADVNGLTVIVSDKVPYTAATSSSAEQYTTYLLGTGAIQTAQAPVLVPVEVYREPLKNGGQESLITRVRETFLINGFNINKQAGDGKSLTDAQLADSARYTPAYDPKAIAVARIVSNG